MAGIAKTVWRSTPLTALGVVTLMASASPHDAKTNLASWWEKSGYPAPAFLRHPHVDTQVIVACAFLFFAWVAILFVLHRRDQRPERPVSYWAASDTMRYMAENSRWARELERFSRYDADLSERWGTTVIERKSPWLLVPSEFVKEASKVGTPIRVMGTRSDSGVVELIEPHFWTSNIIGWHSSTGSGQESYTHPSIASMPRDSLVYHNLRIGQAGVRKTWPPVPLWLKVWDKVVAMKDDPNSHRVLNVCHNISLVLPH